MSKETLGPRHCVESTEFTVLGQGKFDEVTFDLQLRLLVDRDPAFFYAFYLI